MSKNIKGFRIKGQVYPVSGGTGGTNECFTCNEELAPLFEVKTNGKYYKRINLQNLINYLIDNFDHNNLIDDNYTLTMLVDFSNNSGAINITKNGSYMEVDFNGIGFGYWSDYSDDATSGVLGTLTYLLENEYEFSKEWDLDISPWNTNILKLYAYLGYNDSGWIGEYKPVSLTDIANFVEDAEIQTQEI